VSDRVSTPAPADAVERWRKKPVEVRAEQFLAAGKATAAVRGMSLWPDADGFQPRDMSWGYVTTIHGQRAHVQHGDWIIDEGDGVHFYPCKPDIFAATYEPADSGPAPADAVDSGSALSWGIAALEVARECGRPADLTPAELDAVLERLRTPSGATDEALERLTTMADEMDGVSRIAAERRRQVEREGYDTAHDDTHNGEELARCAALYALPSYSRLLHQDGVPVGWPFDCCDWKPGDRIRELEKAGALIAAEIDRLLRLDGSARAASSEETK
jgi:hypothetical protein